MQIRRRAAFLLIRFPPSEVPLAVVPFPTGNASGHSPRGAASAVDKMADRVHGGIVKHATIKHISVLVAFRFISFNNRVATRCSCFDWHGFL